MRFLVKFPLFQQALDCCTWQTCLQMIFYSFVLKRSEWITLIAVLCCWRCVDNDFLIISNRQVCRMWSPLFLLSWSFKNNWHTQQHVRVSYPPPPPSLYSPSPPRNIQNKTGWANAQMTHIRHTGFLHSHLVYILSHHEHFSCFLQLYNIITRSVLAFLWPWVDIKVIQTGIKL